MPSQPQYLPTWVSGGWCVAAFKDSLISTLGTDQFCKTLSMYFYAVTQSGWDQVCGPILQWKKRVPERNVLLYVGTDHGITDPDALEQISHEGVNVRLMLKYEGIYHPKLLWLQGERENIVWVGSNNLTRDGLLNNVEFALLVKASEVPQEFTRWAKLVDQGSVKLSSNLLESYMRQRRSFEKDRAKKGFLTFTLQEKDESTRETCGAIAKSGDLVVEVMPKETGGDGRQMQLPVQVAADFFGLKGVGSTKDIHLCAKGCAVEKILTMRVFRNNTVRITISDLEYRDRPCVLVFRKVGKSKFSYEIVSKSIFPSRYKYLLDSCNKQTRAGSRRWGVA